MQKKRAISLIVLVITIIVMIVLAGAIILSLNNSGIIGKANEAVIDTDEATVKELAQMAWAEAYADGARDVKVLKSRVNEALQENGVDITETSKYLINVTEKGVTIKLKTNAWIQDGLKVVRGDENLEIGQTVSFDEGVESYIGGWKVLGADADGNLLIMSDMDVVTVELGGSTVVEAHESWKMGASEITEACQKAIPIAGKNNVIRVRSIEVEDIDKITGYDKTTFETGTIYEYGNRVTYTYNGTAHPTYTGTNGVIDTLTTDHSEKGFYWSDGKTLHHVSSSDLTNLDNAEKEDKIITELKTSSKAVLTSNMYWYYPTTLTISPDGEIKGIGKTTSAYIMLFRNGDNTANVTYWLASPFVYAYAYNVYFGMRLVNVGGVGGNGMFGSNGGASTPEYGTRAVIVLQSDVPMSSLTK